MTPTELRVEAETVAEDIYQYSVTREGIAKALCAFVQRHAADGGWRCFHCGEVFIGTAAEEHFGRREDADPPACISTKHPLVIRLRARIVELEKHAQHVGKAERLRGWIEGLDEGLAAFDLTDHETIEERAVRKRLRKLRADLGILEKSAVECTCMTTTEFHGLLCRRRQAELAALENGEEVAG